MKKRLQLETFFGGWVISIWEGQTLVRELPWVFKKPEQAIEFGRDYLS